MHRAEPDRCRSNLVGRGGNYRAGGPLALATLLCSLLYEEKERSKGQRSVVSAWGRSRRGARVACWAEEGGSCVVLRCSPLPGGAGVVVIRRFRGAGKMVTAAARPRASVSKPLPWTGDCRPHSLWPCPLPMTSGVRVPGAVRAAAGARRRQRRCIPATAPTAIGESRRGRVQCSGLWMSFLLSTPCSARSGRTPSYFFFVDAPLFCTVREGSCCAVRSVGRLAAGGRAPAPLSSGRAGDFSCGSRCLP